MHACAKPFEGSAPVAGMHTRSIVSSSGTPLELGRKFSVHRFPSRQKFNTGADPLHSCKSWWQAIRAHSIGISSASTLTGTARKQTCKAVSHVPPAVFAVNRHTVEIQPLGLRLWRINGDGRCLFRALAQGAHQLDKGQPLKVAEEQPAADQLRKLICSKLRSKQDDISPFLEVPFDQYIDGMSQASTWGGEPELSVAPECLSRPVDVYMNGATGLQVMSSYTSPYCGKSEPVKVLFNGIGHYDLLIDNSPASRL